MNLDHVLMVGFGVLALMGASGVLLFKRTMHAAMSLVGCLASVAVLFLLLHASFLGLLQLVIYAGAIMILFIIVISLMDSFREPEIPSNRILGVLSVVLGCVFCFILLRASAFHPSPLPLTPKSTTSGSDTAALARLLFQRYLVPFEAITILVMSAIIGAVRLTHRPGRSLMEDNHE